MKNWATVFWGLFLVNLLFFGGWVLTGYDAGGKLEIFLMVYAIFNLICIVLNIYRRCRSGKVISADKKTVEKAPLIFNVVSDISILWNIAIVVLYLYFLFMAQAIKRLIL